MKPEEAIDLIGYCCSDVAKYHRNEMSEDEAKNSINKLFKALIGRNPSETEMESLLDMSV